MARVNRFVAPAAALVVVAGLAACAPTTEEISGIGSTTPSPSLTTPGPQPTPSEISVDDTRPGLPDFIPEVKGNVLDGLAPALTEEQLNALDLPTVPGFKEEQVRQAVNFATAFTSARYNLSSRWSSNIDQIAGSPVFFYPFTNYLTAASFKDIQDMLVNPDAVAKNIDFLDTLAPPPPGIDGAWMVPALGNWSFSEPQVVASGKDLTVAFEAAGAAIYKGKDGIYYNITVRDRVAYTLTVENGKWRVVEWASDVTYGQPEMLEVAPIGRSENIIPNGADGQRPPEDVKQP